MIPECVVIRLLQKERTQWKKRKTEMATGFIYGLNYALSTIHEIATETHERMKDNPRYLAALYQRGNNRKAA